MMPEKYGNGYMYEMNVRSTRNPTSHMMPHPIRNMERTNISSQAHPASYSKCHTPYVKPNVAWPSIVDRRPAVDLRTMDNPDFIPVSQMPREGSREILSKTTYYNFPNQQQLQYYEPNFTHVGNFSQNCHRRPPTYREHIAHQAGEKVPCKTDVMYEQFLTRLYASSLSQRNVETMYQNRVNDVCHSPLDEIAFQKEYNSYMMSTNHMDFTQEVPAPEHYYELPPKCQCVSPTCAHKTCSVMSKHENQTNGQLHGNCLIDNNFPEARHSAMRLGQMNYTGERVQNQNRSNNQLQQSSSISNSSSGCSSVLKNQKCNAKSSPTPYPRNIKPLETSTWIKAIEQVFKKELGQIDRSLVCKHIAAILNKDKNADAASIMSQLKQLLEGLKVELLLNDKKSTKSTREDARLHAKQNIQQGLGSSETPEKNTRTTSEHAAEASETTNIPSNIESIEDKQIITKIENTTETSCDHKPAIDTASIKHEVSTVDETCRENKFRIKQETDNTTYPTVSVHNEIKVKKEQDDDSVQLDIKSNVKHERTDCLGQLIAQSESLCMTKSYEEKATSGIPNLTSTVVTPQNIQEIQQGKESTQSHSVSTQHNNSSRDEKFQFCHRNPNSLRNTRRQDRESVTDLAKRLIEEEMNNLKSASFNASGKHSENVNDKQGAQQRHDHAFHENFPFLSSLNTPNLTQSQFGLAGEVMRDLLKSRENSQEDNFTDQSKLPLDATSHTGNSNDGLKRKRDASADDVSSGFKLKFRKSSKSSDKKRSSDHQNLFSTTPLLAGVDIIDFEGSNNQKDISVSQEQFDSLFS
ncbi:hypothetical protein FSP39_003596 [Pinctada imbricata]|uniref:Uncharacterized protein n=1 Tax=Pinctada imbricata TaxID=66713 RepID=A0AA88YUN1_PINIB|nr:hypothetical protein FSP39_003596 [Pinctada imbricata]